MEQLLASLPARVIAIGAIIIGLILILINDPPKTICDTQLEVFKEAQQRFLFKSQINGISRTAAVEKQLETCRGSAGPGGCFELFEMLKRMLADLENVPRQCSAAAGELSEVRRALYESARVMALMAWGDRAPVAYTQRYGWFDSADIALFCRIKHQATSLYGKEEWEQFRNSVSRELPQANTLTPEQVWQRSIFSTSCQGFK
jgi:hypothetical protein